MTRLLRGVLAGVILLAALEGTNAAAAMTHDVAKFFPPTWGGGYMLMDAGNGFGEPLNVIISGKSSPEVLTNDGFLNWAQSLGFSYECFGLHGGSGMKANLGDGRGWVRQLGVFREDYDIAVLGTCLETFVGGNHFRAFRQEGPRAKTGALFLSVSHEDDLGERHEISPNGYNLGRDELVARATGEITEHDDILYSATSEDLVGLLHEGTQFINHNISIDGVVKLLTVRIAGKKD